MAPTHRKLSGRSLARAREVVVRVLQIGAGAEFSDDSLSGRRDASYVPPVATSGTAL